MARISGSTWKAVLAIAAIALVIGMMTSGFLIWGIAILVLLLALGGGALLYNRAGPPER